MRYISRFIFDLTTFISFCFFFYIDPKKQSLCSWGEYIYSRERETKQVIKRKIYAYNLADKRTSSFIYKSAMCSWQISRPSQVCCIVALTFYSCNCFETRPILHPWIIFRLIKDLPPENHCNIVSHIITIVISISAQRMIFSFYFTSPFRVSIGLQ